MIEVCKEKQVLPVSIEFSKILIHSFLSQNVTVSQILLGIILNILSFYCRDFIVIILPNIFLFLLFVFVNNGYIICKVTTNRNSTNNQYLFSPLDYSKNILSNDLLDKCSPSFKFSYDNLSDFVSNEYQRQDLSVSKVDIKSQPAPKFS